MKYKLGVVDRLKLLELLPVTGDIATVKIVRETRKALIFSESEHVEFGIDIQEPGTCHDCNFTGFAASDGSCPACKGGNFEKTGRQQINWNQEAERGIEIDISVKASSIIVESLRKFSEDGLVTDQHITLFDIFLPDGE